MSQGHSARCRRGRMSDEPRVSVLWIGLLFALLLAAAAPTPLAMAAVPPLGLYEDFSSATIDAAKWQDREANQEIRDGKLVASFRGAMAPGFSGSNLKVVNPATVLTFQADVRLNAYTVPTNGIVSMRLRGSYYNDGAGGTSATGDVRAQLYLRGTSAGVEHPVPRVQVHDRRLCDDALALRGRDPADDDQAGRPG